MTDPPESREELIAACRASYVDEGRREFGMKINERGDMYIYDRSHSIGGDPGKVGFDLRDRAYTLVERQLEGDSRKGRYEDKEGGEVNHGINDRRWLDLRVANSGIQGLVEWPLYTLKSSSNDI
jgi:hypothetical protein